VEAVVRVAEDARRPWWVRQAQELPEPEDHLVDAISLVLDGLDASQPGCLRSPMGVL
jgi:hypothetical protein